MKSRILLKEIPSGKFHSAIFTTFSLNLYYLEQQVLPLLGNKGIHYVSILADSKMLSSQLEHYAQLSQQRKRNYAIHGIPSSGAFHPKLIFLAGSETILLLLGSGNLTSSGHGKNLEVWNPLYITNIDDEKYGFVIQAWKYLKELHADLGDSANNKIKSIEENCFLLSNVSKEEAVSVYELDKHSKISFHANYANNPLFKQVSETIGNDNIERITIMSPYHDAKGKFIQELNSRYEPKEINILVQVDFGALPHKMQTQKNVRFFEWTRAMQEKHPQAYFHAKNIVFESKKNNYLVSGSANASIAAFGTIKIPATNQESCIIYQSSKTDFLNILGIKLNSITVNLKDYSSDNADTQIELSNNHLTIFIKSSEKNFDKVIVLANSKRDTENAHIRLFDSAGLVQSEKAVSLVQGDNSIQLTIPNGISLMYAQLFINTKEASNRQFVIDINAFEGTNPSPRNRSLNQIKKLIESGNFSTPKIIDYLNTIYRQKETKKGITQAGLQEERKEEIPKEQEDDILYLSYAKIQERARQINNLQKATHYIEYKGVRLWESIFSYLKENREKEVQAKIDEEETEDINKSSGRMDKKEIKPKRAISKSNYDRLKGKVEKFLDSYYEILLNKTQDSKSEKPSLIDLSMYLIMLEILMHLIGHKERIVDENCEKHLLKISFSKREYSWTMYLLQFIGMFTIWCSQKFGFKEFESVEYELKLEHYKKMAFKTNLSAMAICGLANEDNENGKLNQWLHLNLLNSNQVFNPANHKYKDMEEFISFIPQKVIDDFGEGIIEDEITNNLTLTYSFKSKKVGFKIGDFYNHPEIGFTYLNKVIKNPKNTFYKLFSPGFKWDDEVNNYWNGYVYSIKENRWLKSKKD